MTKLHIPLPFYRPLCLALFVGCVCLTGGGCDVYEELSSQVEKDKPPTDPQGNLFPIKLSTGVALAQTLPSGTAMTFSVTYSFIEGSPQPGERYIWVIQPAQGEAVKEQVQLNSQGTLMKTVPQWRKQDGPFRTHIERLLDDETSQQTSDSLPLR